MSKEQIAKVHDDCAALENLLRPYTLIGKYRCRYVRIRGVEIPQDKHNVHLIELTHLIDAIWDAATGCKELGIPPIDPETNREKHLPC
jgi:hypothetical protein